MVSARALALQPAAASLIFALLSCCRHMTPWDTKRVHPVETGLEDDLHALKEGTAAKRAQDMIAAAALTPGAACWCCCLRRVTPACTRLLKGKSHGPMKAIHATLQTTRTSVLGPAVEQPLTRMG